MEDLSLDINVILVEPSGPLNVGSVARLCQNFGVRELRLVAPRCDPNNEEARKMAVKGKHLLDKAKQYSCLLDAIADCRKIVATSGRVDHGSIPLCSPKEGVTWALGKESKSSIALVFGREDRGLTNEELLLAHKTVTIKTQSSYSSLNLSHAVGILLHEFHCNESQTSQENQDKKTFLDPSAPEQLHLCLKDAEALLLEIGFLYKHTASARMAKIRALLQRAEIQQDEVSLIRGILRQIRWAMSKENS